MQAKKPSDKKAIQKEVANSLAQLELLKAVLGKKKFEKRIQKATKLLTARLPKKKKDKKEKLVNADTPIVRGMNQPPAEQEAAVNQ